MSCRIIAFFLVVSRKKSNFGGRIKRLKREDYETDISNGRYEPASAKHS